MKKLKQREIVVNNEDSNRFGIQTKGGSKVKSKMQCFNISY